jgi:4,4'-diaponeurosporenoate glycosyltransferase
MSGRRTETDDGQTARVLAAWFALRPSLVATALFVVGWSCGWLLLARPRHLRPTPGATRPPVTVVVPARDEAAMIGRLLVAVTPQLRLIDRLVVVDDHSTDGTADIARSHGATVIAAPDLPKGWAGKPHACSVGAASSVAEGDGVLVFLDADVVPGPRLLEALATTVAARPDTLVTVQPWHRAERLHEQWSLLFNLAALMGSGAFSPLGHRRAGRVAFGPVLACSRARYETLGGHAHPEVRAAVLEDIALARRFGRVDISVGARGDTEFRMYPVGLRSLVQGWTKGMGIGLDATPWWAVLGVAGWMWSLAGGWLASPWFWAASALQLWVLGRVAGRWSPLAVALHPLLTAGFVVVVGRSVVLRRLGRAVAWKGRQVRPDQATG